MTVQEELAETRVAIKALGMAEGIILLEHGCETAGCPKARRLRRANLGILALRGIRETLEMKTNQLGEFPLWADAGDSVRGHLRCWRWGKGADRCVLGREHIGPCRDAEGNTTLTLRDQLLGRTHAAV